jgi:hypothetical protein
VPTPAPSCRARPPFLPGTRLPCRRSRKALPGGIALPLDGHLATGTGAGV